MTKKIGRKARRYESMIGMKEGMKEERKEERKEGKREGR